MKNIIIGYGETLTSKVTIKSGSGEKSHPYTLSEAKHRFIDNLSHVLTSIVDKPSAECANDEVVIKFIQHPAYLSKSYYPKSLFKKFGMRDVGSKPLKIRPDKWGVKKHPEEGLSSCIFVSGKKSQYAAMLRAVESEELEKTILSQILTIEKISNFNGIEKIKNISHDTDELRLEVVLHASETDISILKSFGRYLSALGGASDFTKAKTVGGLTFVPVTLQKGEEEELAKFSHLRVMRSIPKLRFNKPNVTRTNLQLPFSLPSSELINSDIKVCVFDGGIGDNHLLHDWVTEIVPPDIQSSHPAYLSHGGEVCSTYLFGPYNNQTNELGKPYTKVDVIRVLSPGDNDPDLFDVLSRIEEVLKLKKYKYVNLSLGPRMAVEDDEVHVWTSVIDSLLQDGSCLATVAIGNDGELGGEYSRIQPPSDMVNSFAIGASDSIKDDWKKASYSCIGPGRSPGLIKPDGVMFGGSEDELFHVYSPQTDNIVGTLGTSYSAPYALRVAAGIDAITDLDLKTSTVKAIMVHSANNNDNDIKEVGWGRMPSTPEEALECSEDEATIVYQGEMMPAQHLRIPIPVPENLDCTWVHLKATFCINTITDPEHPLHYTRGGLDITFRANDSNYKKNGEHPDSKSFFSCGKLYPNEQELRDDAHKWETCISRSERFKKTTLVHPIFDVKYHAREKGAAPFNEVEPISYSLIVSIKAVGDVSLYNSVLQQNRTLQAVKVSNRIRL